jgi:hypothetical protein
LRIGNCGLRIHDRTTKTPRHQGSASFVALWSPSALLTSYRVNSSDRSRTVPAPFVDGKTLVKL